MFGSICLLGKIVLYFIYMKERMIAGENGSGGLLVKFAESLCGIFCAWLYVAYSGKRDS